MTARRTRAIRALAIAIALQAWLVTASAAAAQTPPQDPAPATGVPPPPASTPAPAPPPASVPAPAPPNTAPPNTAPPNTAPPSTAPANPAQAPNTATQPNAAPPNTAVPPSPVAPPTMAGDPLAAAVESFYRLQPSDVILVKYRYTPEYDATVAVRPDGFISLPIVGEVRVGGLTVGDTQREIVKQAAVRLRDPELTVELKDFQKPRFVVGGEVAKPGQFELRGRVTVLEAVAMAGGLKTSAKHSQVVLFRRYGADQAVTRVINAKALARANAMEEDPVLLPGDFLFVPQNRISKIERFVPMSSVGWLLNLVIP